MEFTIKKQNLCEHGYSVANLFYIICKELKIKVSVDDMMLVLNHDFIEAFTGDLNLKVKNKSQETASAWDTIEKETVPKGLEKYTDSGIFKSLSKEKYNVFIFVDCLEAFLYCKEELKLGNGALLGAFNHYRLKTISLIPNLNLTEESYKNLKTLILGE